MFRYITAMVLQSEAIQTTVTLQNLSSLQNSGLSPLQTKYDNKDSHASENWGTLVWLLQH